MEDFVQQQALSVIDKPVTEVQNIAAGILREQSQSPGVDRALVRELRQFLKQPLLAWACNACAKRSDNTAMTTIMMRSWLHYVIYTPRLPTIMARKEPTLSAFG